MKLIQALLLGALAGAMWTVGCGGDDESGAGGGGTGGRVDDILALDGDATNGQTVYTNTCGITSCHGSMGNNGAANAGDLPTLIPERSEEQIITTVIEGFGDMISQSQLEDQQVADVVAYVKNEWQ